ncbi:hypothetical protein B9479_003247 [Cryptococcus floricola]|uniref:HECT-type E3 ubiquitin transferase n=1 Tax=Cryptococcus floricola TaxID=2591691 RepID=A0A5D3AXB7_9TREE|nr:hypothetical protein B9479_003247 [Cryptococcus floricola]
MFDPTFLNDGHGNNVNLSTRTSTSSSALLSSVRTERLAREHARRQELAAISLQKHWRGKKDVDRLRVRILEDLEQNLASDEGLSVEKAGRAMVVMLRSQATDSDELARTRRVIGSWCEAGLKEDDGKPRLMQPLVDDPEWGVVLGSLSVKFLRVVEHHPTSPEVPGILAGLEAIVSLRTFDDLPQHAVPDWLDIVQRHGWVDTLVSISRKLIKSSPPKKKHPLLSPVIRLIAAPLLMSRNISELAPTITALLNQLLTIPNLPGSLPLPALTFISGHLHIFDILVPFASHNPHILSEHGLSDESGKTYFLANLATFGISGQLLSQSGIVGACAWMSVVGVVLSGVKEGWGKWVEGIEQDEDVVMAAVKEDSDDDEQGGATAAPRKPTRPRRAVLPQNIRSKLVHLSTPSHMAVLSQYVLSPPRNAPPTLLEDFSSFCIGLLNASRGSPKWETILDSLVDGRKGLALMKGIWRDGVRGRWDSSEDPSMWNQFSENRNVPALLLLTHLYCHYLLFTPDDEFFSPSHNPFTTDEVLQLAVIWRNLAFWGYLGGVSAPLESGYTGRERRNKDFRGSEDARSLFTKGVTRVAERNARNKFTDPEIWVMNVQMDMKGFVEAAVYEDVELSGLNDTEPEIPDSSLPHWARSRQRYSKRQLAYISPRLGLLNNLPMSIPFETRLQVFQMFIEADKTKIGIDYHSRHQRLPAKIRRDHVAQDGFDELASAGPALKGRVDISFVDQHGITEAGIDGGGLYKEFLTILTKEVFDSNRGLWLVTNQNELYPNPHDFASESFNLSWYRFIGQMLGKAIYDGILVDATFAGFFLAKWLGRQSYLDDLASLDKSLYKGLIILKNDPKPEDMALTFSMTEEDFGVQKQVDLIPGGSDIPVTADNRHEYIQLVCKYKLDKQIAAQSKAFFLGLSDLIDAKWLRMFDQQELQQLIGGEETPIDLKDLRAHCHVDGFPNDTTPTLFWKVVGSFTEEQKRDLLRFVTSCSRPPLLGFSQLYPAFAVKFNGSDMDRLPTASACFNLLKLPGYTNEATLRSKLLQAITSGAGFDMS